jgi:hypothetical protein
MKAVLSHLRLAYLSANTRDSTVAENLNEAIWTLIDGQRSDSLLRRFYAFFLASDIILLIIVPVDQALICF